MTPPAEQVARPVPLPAYFRAGGRLLLIALVLLLMIGPYWLAQAQRAPNPWPQRFLRAVARLAGMRVRVEGAPRPARALYVANHLSWLDIIALSGATGCSLVSKAEVGDWPMVGFLARANRSVFVRREDRRGASQQVEMLRAALSGERPVAVYPEGTVNDGRSLLPFRAALLAAVAPPPDGVVVQPVAIDYGPAAPDIAWGQETGRTNVPRVLGRRGRLPVTLRFLPPLPPMADRKAVARAAEAAIAAALGASPAGGPHV